MASQRFMPDIQASLEGIPAIIQQAQQFLQKFKPPQPQDPTQVLMAETQRKAQYDQGKLQLDQQKLQLDQARVSRETQLDQIKMQERQMDLAAKQTMNDADNRTAKELAVFEAEHGGKSNLSTGHGINP
jgi:hypothetical protein